MKLLIIGGCHTYGFGVAFGQGFVQRIATELARSATSVTLDYYAPASTSGIKTLLAQLGNQLGDYDLILLQPAEAELYNRSFRAVFRPIPAEGVSDTYTGHIVLDHQTCPASVHVFHDKPPAATDSAVESCQQADNLIHRLRRLTKQALLLLAHRLGRIDRLTHQEHSLNAALVYLKPYRSRVILVAPTPTRDELTNQLRRMAGAIFIKQGQAAHIRVVDSFRSVALPDAALLPDGYHLNSFGHAQLTEAILHTCRRMGLLPRRILGEVLQKVSANA